MKVHNEIERHRVRRALAEVKHKLEEALRLSEQLAQKESHGRIDHYASSSLKRAWTATIVARRSSHAPCATPGWK